MKRLILYALCLGSGQISLAQEVPPAPTSPGIAGMLQTSRSFVYLDLVHSWWMDKPVEVENHFWSAGYNLGVYYEIFLSGNRITLAPGLALSNMTFKTNCELAYRIDANGAADSLLLLPISSSAEYEKSKFSFTYLDVPLELRFRIKPEARGRNFWVAPGFRIGMLLGDFWKASGEAASIGEFKFKQYKIVFTENFHYGMSLRAGYHKFGVYALYSLSDLFEEGRAAGLAPFSAGITLNPF